MQLWAEAGRFLDKWSSSSHKTLIWYLANLSNHFLPLEYTVAVGMLQLLIRVKLHQRRVTSH